MEKRLAEIAFDIADLIVADQNIDSDHLLGLEEHRTGTLAVRRARMLLYLTLLSAVPWASTRQVAAALGCSSSTLDRALRMKDEYASKDPFFIADLGRLSGRAVEIVNELVEAS